MPKQMKVIGMAVVAILFAAGMAISQDRYGGSLNSKEHGYQHGYRDGLRQGREDLYRHDEHNFNTREFKRADEGYERYMGEHDDFQHGYRDGYKAGYDDGYYGRQMRTKMPTTDTTRVLATRIATRSYIAGDLCAVTRTHLTGDNCEWEGIGRVGGWSVLSATTASGPCRCHCFGCRSC